MIQRARFGIPNYLWAPIILTYACILPRELTVEVGGAALFPYRAGLIAFLPYVLGQAIQRLKRFSIIDLFAAFAALWQVVALLVTEASGAGFVRGVAQGMDFGIAYLVGRATLRSAKDFRLYFLAMLPGVGATAAILMFESLSGQLILRPLVAEIFGQTPPSSIYERERFGLFRASGPFPHPILGGVFMASTLPFAWLIPTRNRVKAFAVVASLAAIFTVSSTALVAFLFCGALLAMLWFQRQTRLPIFMIVGIFGFLAYVALSILSESGPLSVFSRYVLLDPTSSYYRMLIWEYAGAEALNHPFFGIGLRDWTRLAWMVESIDSYWLSSAMRFGFPMAIAAFLTIAGAVAKLYFCCKRAPLYIRDTAFAIGATLSVLIVSGFSVHLWEGVATWMTVITGAAVSIAQTEVAERRSRLSIRQATSRSHRDLDQYRLERQADGAEKKR